MKKYTTFLLAFVFVLFIQGTSHAQNLIAEYELTEDLLPSTQAPNITASALYGGPGIANVVVDGGAFANGWSTGLEIDESKWFGIEISADAGYEIAVSEIHFGFRSAATGPARLEVYWSTDGIMGNSSRVDSVYFSRGFDYTSNLEDLNIVIPEGETMHLRWYAYDAVNPAGNFRLTDTFPIRIEGTVTETEPPTTISFSASSAVVFENSGTTNVSVSIENPTENSVSADVVLISGNSASINGFTSQTVVFPAESTTDQTVTLTLTDDAICGTGEELIFELQNISDSAQAGIPAQFTLTILDDDQPDNTAYINDFESDHLSEWFTVEPGSWTTSSTNPISGLVSMKHNLTGVAGASSAAVSLNDMDLNLETTWSFQLKNGSWTTTDANRFWVYLAADDIDLLPSSNTSGYAVGVNLVTHNKRLTLFRIDEGTATPMVESAFEWNGQYTVGIEINRSQLGEWTLRYDEDGGLDNLISAGSAIDNTYLNAAYFGPGFQFTQTRAGQFWVDDITIAQNACSDTYYSQASGAFTDAIWSDTPVGDAVSTAINRYNSFVIQDGHEVSWQNDHQIYHLTIENGATLAHDAEVGAALDLAGNWSNDGSFIAGNSRVAFIDAGNGRSISGNNQFFDLEISLSGGAVQLNNATDINGTLLLTSGELDLNSHTFTLKSDANHTAAIGQVKNGTISGNVTVERYIQNGVNSWRNIAAPVDGATLESWNQHFTTTGFPGSDYPNWPSAENRFPNIKSYDETDLGDREIGWRAATHITNSIAPGQGFWMYIGGSELPNTVAVTGSIVTGDHTLNLDYTPNLGAYHDGWNLIGNVYAATIDWDHPDFERSGLENSIWIWNQDVQQYGSYINGISTHTVSNEIAHSQSFWVRADAENPTLTFRESIKTDHNDAPWIKSQNESQGIVRIQLTGNGYQDETVLVINENASTGYEGTHDAMKFFSDNEAVPSLATVVTHQDETLDLAINSFNLSAGENVMIPLKTLTQVNGTYTLSITELSNLPSSACIYIEDLFSGEVTLIEEGASATINLSAEETTPRFMIHVSGSMITATNNNLCFGGESGWLAATGSGTGPWTYTWTNDMDEVVQLSENSYQTDTLIGVAAGSYYVTVNGNDVCGARGEYLTIDQPEEISAAVDITIPFCNLEPSGAIVVSLAGGTDSWLIELNSDNEILNEITTDGNLVQFDGLSAGDYIVSANNACGTIEIPVALYDDKVVVADFDLSENEVSLAEGGSIMATNTSQNALLYFWEMGDGTVYQTTNINHSYSEPGQYTINLYSANGFCDDMISKSVTVIDHSVGINNVVVEDDLLTVWYDGNQINIHHKLQEQEVGITLTNLLGKTMVHLRATGNEINIPINGMGYAPGIYFVNVAAGDIQQTRKMVLNR